MRRNHRRSCTSVESNRICFARGMSERTAVKETLVARSSLKAALPAKIFKWALYPGTLLWFVYIQYCSRISHETCRHDRGFACADPNFPGVNSRVSSSFAWIRAVVCQESSAPPPYLGCPNAPARAPDTVPEKLERPADDDKGDDSKIYEDEDRGSLGRNGGSRKRILKGS